MGQDHPTRAEVGNGGTEEERRIGARSGGQEGAREEGDDAQGRRQEGTGQEGAGRRRRAVAAPEARLRRPRRRRGAPRRWPPAARPGRSPTGSPPSCSCSPRSSCSSSSTTRSEGGPAHGEFSFGDGIPATLYLPVDAEDDGDLPEPLPKGERPPVIVMAHGYSADRASMSGMARSLARAGYAVVNIDLRGHGSNTHAFRGDLRRRLRRRRRLGHHDALGRRQPAGGARPLDGCRRGPRLRHGRQPGQGGRARVRRLGRQRRRHPGPHAVPRGRPAIPTASRSARTRSPESSGSAGGQVTAAGDLRRPHHDPPRRRHHRCDHGVPRPAPRHPPRRRPPRASTTRG